MAFFMLRVSRKYNNVAALACLLRTWHQNLMEAHTPQVPVAFYFQYFFQTLAKSFGVFFPKLFSFKIFKPLEKRIYIEPLDSPVVKILSPLLYSRYIYLFKNSEPFQSCRYHDIYLFTAYFSIALLRMRTFSYINRIALSGP